MTAWHESRVNTDKNEEVSFNIIEGCCEQGSLHINEDKTQPLLHAWLLLRSSSLIPGEKSITPSHMQVQWRGIHSPGSQQNSLPISPEAQNKSPQWMMGCTWSLLSCRPYLRLGLRCSWELYWGTGTQTLGPEEPLSQGNGLQSSHISEMLCFHQVERKTCWEEQSAALFWFLTQG